MYIDKIVIENFRCFAHKEIHFHPQFNVLIGENGIGKTAVMDAIVMHLYHELIDIDKKITKFWGSKQDVRIGQNNYLNTLTIIGSQKYILEGSDGVRKGTSFFENEIKKPKNKPIFVHYPSHRMFYNITLDSEKQEEGGISLEYQCYANAFDFTYARFEDFLNWFVSEETTENAEKVRKKDFNLNNPQLEVLRKGLSTFLSSVMGTTLHNLRTEKSNLINGVSYSLYDIKPTVLVIDKESISLHINQLSSGEQIILLFVCDIVRRLTLANPNINDPLNGEGIIFIDEIDLHLHPNWQKNIVGALKQTFPKIQFIVTTHSPFIVQSDVDRLIDLSKNRFIDSEELSDLSLNEIAHEIMGVESVYSNKNHQKEIQSENYLVLLEKAEKDLAHKSQYVHELELQENAISDPGLRALLRMERIAKNII